MDIIIIIIILLSVCCCCCIISSSGYYFTQSSSSKPSAPTSASAPKSASAPTSASSRAQTNTKEDEDEDEESNTTPAPITPAPITYKFKKLAPNVNSLPPGLSAGASGSDYNFLGDKSSYEDCEKAALASSDINKIGAITWHNSGFGGGWANKCYSINNTNKFSKTDGVQSGIKQIEPPSNKFKFSTENNVNCIWGRVPSPYVSSDNYHYIGTFGSFADCEKAALADPNINDTKAVSWHDNTHPSIGFRNLCYTINDNNTRNLDTNSTCGIKTAA